MNTRIIKGHVFSASLCEPLENVEIILEDSENTYIDSLFSNVDGSWEVPVNKNVCNIVFQHSGYVSKKYKIDCVSTIIRLLDNILIGYQDKLWYQPGEIITVYVHSQEIYEAYLYRHGIVKECISSYGIFNSCEQIVPDEYFVDKGLSWAKSFDYQLDYNVIPGIYSLLLKSKNSEPFAIPMIVSTHQEQRGKNSKILILASTNTWQSYNIWGGRSRYRSFEGVQSKQYFSNSYFQIKYRKVIKYCIPQFIKKLIKKYILRNDKVDDWVYKRLSIRRPFTNCSLESKNVFKPFTNHLAAGEWRVLAWFERENIQYDYISGAEVNDNPLIFQDYDMVVFSTHCEYWSKKMYEGVKNFHMENNGWILNISGNTMFREIDFYDDGSTRCTSLSFKDSCADETQLLGVRFTPDDYSTCAPYKILDKNHWVFKDIPLNSNDRLFGGLSLNQNTHKDMNRYDPGRPGVEFGLSGMGASGWEMDKLSNTAPKDVVVVAHGQNRGGGADMVVRMPDEQRGGMFSASSLTFGGSLLIDDVTSKIVKNVIDKMNEIKSSNGFNKKKYK